METFCLFLLVWLVDGSGVPVPDAWTEIRVPLPRVSALEVHIQTKLISEQLAALHNHKVIWILGRFKTGKSFIVDYIRNDGVKTADALVNTVGLNIWVKNGYALIDTEGMFQPVGDNDVHFIKNFLLAFMQQTADTIVLVTDQVDVVDMEMYKLVKSFFMGTTVIGEMYHVHNCKSLSAEGLEKYKERVRPLFGLTSDYLDKSSQFQPVTHLFVPKMDGILQAIMSYFGGQPQVVNFMGGLAKKREALSMFTFLNSMNIAFEAAGTQKISSIVDDVSRIQYDSHAAMNLPFQPPRFVFCKSIEGQTNLLNIYVESFGVTSVSFDPESSEIMLKHKRLDHNFQEVEVATRLYSPVIVLDSNIRPWRCQQSEKGYNVLQMAYASGRGMAPLPNCASPIDKLQPCTTVNPPETPEWIISWGDVKDVVLNFVNNFLQPDCYQ